MTDQYQAAATAINPNVVRPRPFDPCAGWPEPDARLLNGGPRPAPGFPMACLGPLAGYVADLAAAKRAPVDYVAAPLLATTAGIVGASRAVRIAENWTEANVLWVACVGNPSSGKSPPLVTIKRAALAIERDEGSDLAERKRDYESRRVEAEAVRAAWEAQVKAAVAKGSQAPRRPEAADEPEEPRAPRMMAGDATREALARLLVVNPRGLLLVLDELQALLGNFGKYGGADEPFYLSAYSGDFAPVDRVKGGTLTAPRAFLSITGCIQPEKFQALLTGRANDGLVSRFIPVWPDPPREWARDVPTVDERRLASVFAKLRSLAMDADEAGEAIPRGLPLSEGAADVFFGWCREQHAKALAAHGFLAEFLGKSKGTCARVALVLELLEWAAGGNGSAEGPREISEQAMARAVTLFDSYFEPMALRVYADAALPEVERHAIALLKEIQKRAHGRSRDTAPKLNVRAVYREWGVPGVSSAADANAACEFLAECGCLRKDKSGAHRSGDTGRRPNDWIVNPRLIGGAA